ncbi:MAG TPA: twin-arginine translocase TatA/TatE family subunit [Chloroflexia bacterium]|nr:twin-arginine translocase TatA/TatE family subunit [Chloroflexia bacterium]
MEIFGIGLPELLLIAVVVLVFVGPERLPETARTIGKGVADFRRAIEPARGAWRDLTSEITSVGSEVSGTVRTIGATTAGSSNGARAPIKPPRQGEVITAIPSDNPWNMHPIMQNMTEEERANFMADGTIPPHIQSEMEARASAESALHPYAPEIVDLDYPTPHEKPSPKPTTNQALEDISYREPTARTLKQSSGDEPAVEPD